MCASYLKVSFLTFTCITNIFYLANDNYTDDNISNRNTLVITFYIRVLAIYNAHILPSTCSYRFRPIK